MREPDGELHDRRPDSGFLLSRPVNGPPDTSPQVDPSGACRPRRNFRVIFSGDPDELAFFLIQAGSYMEVHESEFWSDRERVLELGTQLKGEAANWFVGLVESDAAELYDLEQFLLALPRFEDSLTEEKARAKLQQLRQGTRSVRLYSLVLVNCEPDLSLHCGSRMNTPVGLQFCPFHPTMILLSSHGKL
uniref:Uncharacterized protein n=1 Tax=Sphaerodactylus townsendi TaxID=933632 RepID=A0ACB8EFC0_9SAUR